MRFLVKKNDLSELEIPVQPLAHFNSSFTKGVKDLIHKLLLKKAGCIKRDFAKDSVEFKQAVVLYR